tara:strand:- start:17 stop:1111 length:1095 start_codon:yes stop_codon:yes gene_type:complete
MARISTYDNANPVSLSDKVIGTNVTGSPANATKNFLISDLLALFQDNITLQNVLDAGNTATEDINLTGNISLDGGDLTLDATAALYVGGLLIDSTGATGALGQTLTSDASGNPVWGAGGGGSQNLEQVLTVGNTATNDINLTGDIIQGGNINLTGDITQTGNYGLTGDITQVGDVGLTGDITQGGDYRITGDITHIGGYGLSTGNFVMAATSAMTLDGALTCNSSISLTGTVKDFTDTLGGDGECLVSDASGQVTWQDVTTLPSIVRFSNSTSFTLGLVNQGGVLIMTNAAATTVTIPNDATLNFPVGTKATIIQEGTGQITLAPSLGVTVNSAVGLKFASTNSVAEIVKVDADKWYAYGDLTP